MRLMVRAAVLFGLAVGVIAFAVQATPGGASAAGTEEMQIDMPDGTRSAILVPGPRQRAPTVIVLHGALVSAEYTASWYGFTELARRSGFAAVYPRGQRMLWNDGRPAVIGSAADDAGFLRRLTAELVMRKTSDPARIYLVGVSNGGMMALRMLCESGELYAGVGTIIASMPSSIGAVCHSRRPTSVIMVNGTADPLIPYGGGSVGFSSWQGSVWAVERTAGYLASHNGCGAVERQVVAGGNIRGRAAPASGSGAARVTRLDWAPCSSGRSVTLYRVEGGGHQVYGRTNFYPMLLGPGTKRFSAPERIMAAFAGRRR